VASKRKQKDLKQEAPFQLEEFDEKEYLEEQLRIGKGVFISMAWAVVAGAITFFVFNMFQDNWQYIFIPGFFGVLALYIILPKFNVDLTVIPKKSWFNFVFSFALTWLAIVVISLNPPFSDFSEPSLDDLTLEVQEYNRAMYDNSTPTVRIRAVIRDNYEVSGGKVFIEYPGGSDSTVDLLREEGTGNIYYYNFPENEVKNIMDLGLEIKYTITAEDSRGNKDTITSHFEILGSDTPKFHEEIRKQTTLNVTQVDEEKGIQIILGDNATFAEVYFTIDDDTDEKYYFERGDPLPAEKKYYYNYFASTEYLEKGEYSITVTAVDAGNNVISNNFDFSLSKDGARLHDDEGGSGLLPGFGLVEVLGILLTSLIIIRYFKKKGSV
jgi:hypothetical protein